MKKIFTFCFLSFIFYLSSFIFVQAQDQPRQSALGVSPAIFELVLDPSEEKTTKVTVLNIINFPLPVKASVKSFLVEEEIPAEAKEIFDASSWIKVDPADFILQPRENKEINITISPPKKAEPGGHYATIYFQPLVPVEVLSPQTAYVVARVGVLAFLIVKGEIIEKASIGNLQTADFQQFGPLEFKISFKNEGNIHLLASGSLGIWDWWGKEVAKLDFKPTMVLPKTSQELTDVWPKKYLLGKFSAQAKLVYGSENKASESQRIEFWVVPWIPILVLIWVLTCFVIFLIIGRKRMGLAIKVLLGKT